MISLSQKYTNLIVRNSGCFFIIFLSALLYWFGIKPTLLKDRVLWDAQAYVNYALRIETNQNFFDPLRTYGYAFFLSFIRRVSGLMDLVPWISFVYFVQFIFHTITSFLSVLIFTKLVERSGQQSANLTKLLVFTLVQLNPYLLSLCFEILTDSISVFYFTLIGFFLVTDLRYRFIGVGMTLGLLIVTRPFYGPFTICIVSILVCFFVFSSGKRRWVSIKVLAQMALPLIVLVGFQIFLIYKHEGIPRLTGREASIARKLHFELGPFSYKYETLIEPPNPPSLIYFDEQLRNKISLRDDKSSRQAVLLRNWISVVRVACVRFVGLFQNYEWGVYRTHKQNSFLKPIFVFGLVNWILLVCCSLNAVYLIRKNKHLENLQIRGFLALGLLIHICLYAFLTVPETRFNAPILPLGCCLGILVIQQLKRGIFVTVLLFCLVLYAATFSILSDSVRNISSSALLQKAGLRDTSVTGG